MRRYKVSVQKMLKILEVPITVLEDNGIKANTRKTDMMINRQRKERYED